MSTYAGGDFALNIPQALTENSRLTKTSQLVYRCINYDLMIKLKFH